MTPAASTLKSWRENARRFVYDNFKVHPDHWQGEALDKLPDTSIQRIALKACVGPGKTAFLAWALWYGMVCWSTKGEHLKGAAVSCSGDNLKDNLWPELAKWQGRSEYITSAFTWTKERIFNNNNPETWFISARAWSRKATAEQQGSTLSGLHSKFVIVAVDESDTVPPPVARRGEQALSNCVWGKVIQAGNPSSHEGMLYNSCVTLRHLWHVITITGDPDDAKRSPRIDIAWAREQIQTFGRDNPWIMSSILGQFPPSSINALISPEEVEEAMRRILSPDVYEWAQKRLGVDVARFGDDRSVIAPRQGLRWFDPEIMRLQRTTDIAAKVVVKKLNWGSEQEFVDDSGHWGHGVIDNLFAANYSPFPVLFEAPALNPRYANKRAEMWWAMTDAVKRGAQLPNLPELVRELTAPTYTFVNGKIQLEDKRLIKKRLGFSPDIADGYALTYAHPEMPGDMSSMNGVERAMKASAAGAFSADGGYRDVGRAVTDYDPFEDRDA